MVDPVGPPANVRVTHVDLRGLREAGQLLVGRLGGDDARVSLREPEAHREVVLQQRVEGPEAGPGLVEVDVLAEVADLLDDLAGVVDGAVVGALLDDGHADRTLTLGRTAALEERVCRDLRADGFQRLNAWREEELVAVNDAVQLSEQRGGLVFG